MTTVDLLVAAAIGGLVGAGELIARYRDSPGRALLAPSAWLYIGVNAASSAGALGLILAFGWKFGQTGEAARWTQVLVAGFGAMALFRSSLFVVRVGDQDVGVGPSTFLEVVMNAADRGVDRSRARYRADLVGKVMNQVDYEKAKAALPAYCLMLMQNLPPDLQRDLSSDLKAIEAAEMDPRIKSLNLGLRLMNMIGPQVVRQAVQSLGEHIAPDGELDG